MTGFYNQRWFEERVNAYRKRNNQPEGSTFFILLDIERYKWINESFGFEKGDELLVQVSERLREHCSETHTIVRYDGAKFLLIINKDNREIEATCTQLFEWFAEPFNVLGNPIVLSISLSVYQHERVEMMYPSKITKALEHALRAAKKNGSDWVVYDEAKHSDEREQEILHELKKDIVEFTGFSLYYQPKINLKTRKIDSAEVLLRWENKQLGMVSPAEFIPIAEKYGLIQDLTKSIFFRACQQVKRWNQEHFPIQKLAVNLSATFFQLQNGNEMIKDILEQTEVNPKSINIELEVTETAIMENVNRAIEMLDDLRGIGLTIALDDFGTGLSSLTYLKNLPIDTLKIDKAFIEGIPGDEKDNGITELIVLISKKIGLEIVAEGIEILEQDQFLTSIGCDYGQGYFYSKPLSLEQLTERFGSSKQN
ncbi:putative bifunctional diguanylate cyclase/phosphodiesterase [Bacillus suaedae]|uniref:Bifunctional diguanylate cyclase/phosphodiesterase n=1 Tax=Halalkalibacter suaedae TaxID=2822140 RepID=A0A941APC9_9BACI|nr:bifunctional diguanylate cyclase/phosphodiesterase [Bacillus suaedae]MBP3951357.1 bifunctional diguanylate cyclase/phosphodiesterase [Bacillus suaedae]